MHICDIISQHSREIKFSSLACRGHRTHFLILAVIGCGRLWGFFSLVIVSYSQSYLEKGSVFHLGVVVSGPQCLTDLLQESTPRTTNCWLQWNVPIRELHNKAMLPSCSRRLTCPRLEHLSKIPFLGHHMISVEPASFYACRRPPSSCDLATESAPAMTMSAASPREGTAIDIPSFKSLI